MQAEMSVTARNEGGKSIFEGEVSIAKKTFSYKLTFQVPLSQYMTAGRGRTVAQMRQLVPISVACEGKEIELTDKEWEFFYHAAVPSALKIHNQRQLIKGKAGSEESYAVMAEGGKIILKPDACKILAQPKFGCQLLDSQIDTTKKPS